MVDTARLILSWECNRVCSYCCNNLPGVREQFKAVRYSEIDWRWYRYVALSGGEPLLNPSYVFDLIHKLSSVKFGEPLRTVLYTNGDYLSRDIINALARLGLHGLTIGLHCDRPVDHAIQHGILAAGRGISVRFNLWEGYADDVRARYPEAVPFLRPWVMDACDRANEDRFFLIREED